VRNPQPTWLHASAYYSPVTLRDSVYQALMLPQEIQRSTLWTYSLSTREVVRIKSSQEVLLKRLLLVNLSDRKDVNDDFSCCKSPGIICKYIASMLNSCEKTTQTAAAHVQYIDNKVMPHLLNSQNSSTITSRQN
jgi:hypothetical protein